MEKRDLISLLLIGTLLAEPAFAGSSCLQHNRARNWRAVDEKTIVYTDVRQKDYTVTFRDTCRNLTSGNAVLVNRRWSGLSCLERGHSFRVAVPGQPASTCIVDGVSAAQ